MRHVFLDLNALIDLQNADRSVHRNIIEDPQTAVYLLYEVLLESVRWTSGNADRVLATLAPYVDRVFAGLPHEEALGYERTKLRPISPHAMRRNNEGTEFLRDCIREAANGGMPIQKICSDPAMRTRLDRWYFGSGKFLEHMYNSAHNAWETADQLFGLAGTKQSLLTALRQGQAQADMVFHQCIKHALGSMHVDMCRIHGNVRPFFTLLGKTTYTFTYSLTRWIRVYQQAYSNQMINWQTHNSPEIINEVFDVLGVSFFPYYDDYLTRDQTNIETAALLTLALAKFGREREKYVEQLRRTGKSWSPFPTRDYVRAARKRERKKSRSPATDPTSNSQPEQIGHSKSWRKAIKEVEGNKGHTHIGGRQ